jgi:hypothetical protein
VFCAPTQLPPQQATFFEQIRERLPFPAVQPAGDSEEQHSEGRGVHHERELRSQAHSGVQNQIGRDVGHFGL